MGWELCRWVEEEHITELVERFLTGRTAAVILLTLGLAGIMIEIATAGFGVACVLVSGALFRQ